MGKIEIEFDEKETEVEAFIDVMKDALRAFSAVYTLKINGKVIDKTIEEYIK